jgi:hypothetical protein
MRGFDLQQDRGRRMQIVLMAVICKRASGELPNNLWDRQKV